MSDLNTHSNTTDYRFTERESKGQSGCRQKSWDETARRVTAVKEDEHQGFCT